MADPMDQVRQVLDWTARQVEPDLSKLCTALGEDLDAGAFAMGMMGSVFAMQGMDLPKITAANRGLFEEFVAKCREAQRG